MTIKTLTKTAMLYASVERFSLERGPAAYAYDLCCQHDVALTALLLNTENTNGIGVSARSIAEIEYHSAELERLNAEHVNALEGACSARALDLVTVTAIDYSRGFFRFINDHARLHDLVVCGSSKQGLLNDRLVCEGLLFDAGRPLLLIPQGHESGFSARHIAVAWDNSRCAARALGDSLALLPGVEEVTFVVIDEEKTIDSGIAPEEFCAFVARHKIKASVEYRSKDGRSIGDALQEEALELNADVLVMGAHGHSRLREFILGGATHDVLNQLRLPVMMAH